MLLISLDKNRILIIKKKRPLFPDKTLVQCRGREAAHAFGINHSVCGQSEGDERELGTVSGGVSGKYGLKTYSYV